MVRLLNFACFALAALCCLALYHVSEQTRIARIRLNTVDRQIAADRDAMKVLQADWERVTQPGHIQALAEARLGLSDVPTATFASLDSLPRRGDATPLGSAPVLTASAIASQAADTRLHLVAAHAGN